MCPVGVESACMNDVRRYSVTTCRDNLETSGNLTAVTDFTKSQESVWRKTLVREKLPKTVYCKLHICIHTGI